MNSSCCRRLEVNRGDSKNRELRSDKFYMTTNSFLLLIHLFLVVQFQLSTLVNCLQAVDREDDWKHSAPQRPISPDIIVLDNGSTTAISSLEDYLSRVENEKQSESQLILNTTISNQTLAHLEGSTTESLIKLVPDNEVAKLQLEREETTTLSPKRNEQQAKKEELRHQTNNHHQNEENNQQLHHHHQHHHEQSATNSTNSASKPIPQNWQVRSLLNITHDYPLTYSRLIYGYIWPMVAAITVFTNLMIVFVLTQRDMRTPTNVVLTAIAIADIIPIVVPVPWFIYLFALGNEKRVLYPPIACYFYQHLTRSVSEIFYFLSTWLNVLLAVQDYLTACLPHLAKKYCQLRVVVMQIIFLTLLAFSLNLPQALKLVFRPVKFYYNNQLTLGCKAVQAKWFKDLIGEYVALYDDIFAAIIVIFVDGGPAAALITLTALLIRQLQKQRIQGHLLMEQARTASKRRRERHRQQEYESSARVMIFVLLASLAVKIPFATTYTMMIIQSRFEIHFVENLVDFQTAITITDLAFVLSYPINFTIFCCCSKKFRHKCVQLLGECTHNTKSARNKLMASFSMSLNSSTASQIYKRPSVGTVASQTQPTTMEQDGLLQHQLQDSWSIEPSSTAKGSIFSSSSLDDRHPLVLERLCDGHHHLQWLHPGDRPPRFRALLADGSQCQECMARHEDLWASRRQSADSMLGNWPLPPPPPPLHMLQHYHQRAPLPQIVTTRCESIREQPSSDEANGDEEEEEVVTRPEPEVKSEVEAHKQQQQQHLDHANTWPHEEAAGGTNQAAAKNGGACDTSSYGMESYVEEELSVCSSSYQQPYHQHHHHDSTTYPQVRKSATKESQQEQIDRHEQLQEQERLKELEERNHLRKPEEKWLQRSKETRASSEHQGSNSSFVSLKSLKNLMMRRLSGQEERCSSSCRGDYSVASESADGKQAAHKDGQGNNNKANSTMDDKHSSLSLSNSKLTTLPNATGQLADILMSTLFMSGASRSAFSEPPIHASSEPSPEHHKERSRIKDARRSHG